MEFYLERCCNLFNIYVILFHCQWLGLCVKPPFVCESSHLLSSSGSASATSEGLRRACYIVRAMFASRFDIRQAYYKFSGRVGVIADNEQTTTLPEHTNLTNPAHWDSKTRGVGATVEIPISSAGDDNMRCYSKR